MNKIWDSYLGRFYVWVDQDRERSGDLYIQDEMYKTVIHTERVNISPQLGYFPETDDVLRWLDVAKLAIQLPGTRRPPAD